jgi:type III secretion protein O
MGMLDELLHLKSFREEKAERAVGAGREAVTHAARQEQQAHDALTDYRDWSDRHERQLYDEICRRPVQPRELEWLREDVNALRTKEGELDKLVQQAGQHRGEAETALESLHRVHAEATRVRDKFQQLADADADAERVETERREEAEAEERSPAPRMEVVEVDGGDDDR